ncbi:MULTISPECIES: hypothetical protein [unclassified Streptomyces]|uniref:hypothetical protein n=1 Tax=unclassified Streptomyces TaxID=2593676 RepID=UPI0013A696FD|nr:MULTISPECIES: hypothetical protein [unclassified Streptomyces]
MSHNTGWGQHPGQPTPQWGGGWMPPSAPKPGVIPLQPLATGEILGGAFSTFRRHWKTLVGVMFAAQGIGLLLVAAAIVLTVVAARSRFSDVADLAPGESGGGAWAALLLAFAPAGVLLLVTMTLSAAVTSALCPAVVQEAVLGRPTTFGVMWRRSWSRLPSVLGTLLLTGLIAGGPMLALYAICIPLIITAPAHSGPPAALFVLLLGLLPCLPLSIWLMTRLSLAPAAAVCEGLGPVAALRRSSQLVKDGWWRVFGNTMLAYIVAAAVGYFIQMPFGLVGMVGLIPYFGDVSGENPDVGSLIAGVVVYVVSVLVGTTVSMVFQYGFPQLALALLYVDQRMRKEDLAAVLIASAAPADPVYAPAPHPDQV